jgi:exodeoxyribonuclease VII large subunit
MLDLFADEKQREITERLLELRKNLADRLNTEPSKLWSDKVIDAVAASKPKSPDELKSIKGFSAKKIKDFGDLILFAVNDKVVTANVEEATQVETASVDETLEGLFEDIHNQEAAEKILSVSDYIDYVSQILSVATGIKVQGEISKFTMHPTGVYITLRDKNDDSVLNCYMNPHAYRGLGIPLEAGMEVKVSGFPTIFRRRSELSFRIEDVELAGEGALKKAYELLKKQLETEGLFSRKRELPEYITSIGIITSKSGAVIDDFKKNLEPLGCKLYLVDARVEGTQAVSNILRGIKYFNAKMPHLDCLVIMRGGGSLEDMQAFNHEQVVRAIFASSIPTICAIGHDRDVPLACLVGDIYTSTPTAAAMEINKSWMKLKLSLPQLEDQLMYNFQSVIDQNKNQLDVLSHKMVGYVESIFQTFNHAREILNNNVVALQNKCKHLGAQSRLLVKANMQHFLQTLHKLNQDLLHKEKFLFNMNPERNLKLGYSIVRNNAGKLVRSIKDVKTGDEIISSLSDGTFNATVDTINT